MQDSEVYSPPHLAVVATPGFSRSPQFLVSTLPLSLTRIAQDARLILTAPEPALAECLIPPSAALAYEAHLRGSDAGASVASWDLAAPQPRVRARSKPCAILLLTSLLWPLRQQIQGAWPWGM